MSIQMVGIDHNQASIDLRELFSFTKKQRVLAMEYIKKDKRIKGCIILSTCNRMELWVSTTEDYVPPLLKVLCEIKKVDEQKYSEFFIQRLEEQAVNHLFELACGLQSLILGEDQIITQVKEALSLAREHYMTDHVLEVLFRMAITGAKKVKTLVPLSTDRSSSIHQAIYDLKQAGYSLKDKICMVIGNGEMGRLAASTLKEAGADVTVTIRQYKSGIVKIPYGCRRINYGERMEYFKECDLVISATASPNTTIKLEDVKKAKRKEKVMLIDFAVPRDIEAEIGDLPGITLYDIDDFKGNMISHETEKQIEMARDILSHQIHEFYHWYNSKDLIPMIQETKDLAARDLHVRLQKPLKRLSVSDVEKDALEHAIDESTDKMITKLMFGLKDSMSEEGYKEFLNSMRELYG